MLFRSHRGVVELLPHALPLLLPEVACDEDAVNRRNAAFALGVMLEMAGPAAAGAYPAALGALLPRLAPGVEEDPGTRDNAASAVGRLLASRGGPLPVRQALEALLGALPLQEDMDETAAAYGGVLAVLERVGAGTEPEALPLVPRALAALGECASASAATPAVLMRIGRVLGGLLAAHGPQLSPLLGQLPAEAREALRSLVAANGGAA